MDTKLAAAAKQMILLISTPDLKSLLYLVEKELEDRKHE